MKIIVYVLISLLGGAIVPIQLGIISSFRHYSGASQIQATFYLYVGGAIASLVICYALSGGIIPTEPQKTSWWMWTAGFLGSLYILFMFISAPKIGAANTLVWVFLGQILFATLLDRAGHFNMPVQNTNWLKTSGIILIFLGGILMLLGNRRF